VQRDVSASSKNKRELHRQREKSSLETSKMRSAKLRKNVSRLRKSVASEDTLPRGAS
jgi:hypothetical protein